MLWGKTCQIIKMRTVAFKQRKAGLISSVILHPSTMTTNFPMMTQEHRDHTLQGPLLQLLRGPQTKLVLSWRHYLELQPHEVSSMLCVYKKANTNKWTKNKKQNQKTEPLWLSLIPKLLILNQEYLIPSIFSDKLTG